MTHQQMEIKIKELAKRINALEQGLFKELFKPMVEIDLYSVIKQKYIERDVIDKIRAEIEEQKKERCFDDDDMFAYRTGLDDAIYIIDKYKAESEESDTKMRIVIDIDEKKYKSICDHFMFMHQNEVMFSVKNGIPLDEVLDKIKEEIKDNTYFINEITEKEGVDFETVEKIIDKYKAGSEEV